MGLEASPWGLAGATIMRACAAAGQDRARRLPVEDMDLKEARRRRVAQQIVERGARSERVAQAMAGVPREAFVGENLREFAYSDAPLPIAEGQTISQPCIVAYMAEALELEGDERVEMSARGELNLGQLVRAHRPRHRRRGRRLGRRDEGEGRAPGAAARGRRAAPPASLAAPRARDRRYCSLEETRAVTPLDAKRIAGML